MNKDEQHVANITSTVGCYRHVRLAVM